MVTVVGEAMLKSNPPKCVPLPRKQSPKDKITVRQTTDFDLIESLHQRTFPDDEPNEDESQTHWVVRANGKPVGFCSAMLLDGGVVYLTRAGILPGYRGRGLQKRLLRVRITWAWRSGATAIITYTVLRNYPSIVNLIRCGFQFYEPEYAWVGRNVHYFRMLLP